MNRVEPNRNVYVGHRYVPLLVGEWDKSIQYEGLSIVTFKGASYTSKKMTPPGIDIENEEYWVLTGNYNAQIEYYRLDVKRVKDDMGELDERLTGEVKDLEIYLNDELRENREYVDSNVNDLTTYVNDEIKDIKDENSEFQGDLTEFINYELQLKVDKSNIELNLKDFGAVGDGVTNDTNSLMSAISQLSNGGTLFIPDGKYLINDVIELPSNITIKGVGDNTTIVRNGRGMFSRATASYETPVNVSSDSAMGDHFITVDDVSKFNNGDKIKIISQTVAQSIHDADPDFYLGAPTSSNDAIYFGEFREISDINENTGQLFFRGGLMFPGYRTNNDQETHAKSLPNAIVQKVNFVENIKVKDLSFKGDFSNVFRLDGVYNAVFENVNWYDAVEGDFIAFRNSLNSKAINCGLYYIPNHTPTQYYHRNGFKSVSSTGCGFDGITVSHGGQNVDFSYSAPFDSTGVYPIPDIGGYVKNSTMLYSLESTATAHQGTINTQFLNNTMLYARHQGIFTRSRNGIVDGNTIISGTTEEYSGLSPGVVVANDSSVNTRVTNNTIDGFSIGLQTGDNRNSIITNMNLMIMGNTFINANTGIRLTRGTGSDFTGDSNIFIKNNIFDKFRQDGGKLVDIFERYFNIFIDGNLFNCNNSLNGGIFTRGDSGNIYVTNNNFTGNLPNRVLWFGDIDIDLPSYKNTYLFKGNTLPNRRLLDTSLFTGNLSSTYSDHYYHPLQPNEDATMQMGTPSLRWDRIVTARGVLESSDEKLKDNITDLNHGLDFINKLKPRQYNFIGNDKKSFGLIAQDVEKVLENSDDYSLIDKDEILSLHHTELIPIIIKAIQELQKK